MDQERVLDEVSRWAEAEENVRAVVVTGSVARGEHDPISDIDVELYLRDTNRLLTRDAWYHRFGDVLVVEALENPGWVPTRLVYYVDAKIDFAIIDAASLPGTTYRGPYRVVVDKDGLARDLAVDDDATKPPAAEFFETLNQFWAEALMCARALAKPDVVPAMLRSSNANYHLRRMVEWDHKARYGWSYRTYYLGKRLRTWADDDIGDALLRCYPRADLDEISVALQAAADLFAALATRVGAALGVPPFDHGRVRSELQRFIAVRRTSGQ